MTLKQKALYLERKLEGEDRRTVHHLFLILSAFNEIANKVDDAQELLSVIGSLDEYEEAE